MYNIDKLKAELESIYDKVDLVKSHIDSDTFKHIISLELPLNEERAVIRAHRLSPLLILRAGFLNTADIIGFEPAISGVSTIDIDDKMVEILSLLISGKEINYNSYLNIVIDQFFITTLAFIQDINQLYNGDTKSVNAQALKDLDGIINGRDKNEFLGLDDEGFVLVDDNGMPLLSESDIVKYEFGQAIIDNCYKIDKLIVAPEAYEKMLVKVYKSLFGERLTMKAANSYIFDNFM